MINRYGTLAVLLLTVAGAARAADVPGSKDPAGVKRYTGSNSSGTTPRPSTSSCCRSAPGRRCHRRLRQESEIGWPDQPIHLCFTRAAIESAHVGSCWLHSASGMRPSCCIGSFGSVFCMTGHKKGHTGLRQPSNNRSRIPGLQGQTILVQRRVRHGRVWLCATNERSPAVPM